MMHFPHTIEELKNPNMFTGDTGASSHSSQYQNGMVNLHDGQDGDSVMVGSGAVVKANKIGNILGEVCDNSCTVLQKGQMVNVAHCPEMRCNVYSLTMKLLKGWQLHGNKDSIWNTKGKAKLCFDIKLKTKRGVIYCMFFKRQLTPTEIASVSLRLELGTAHDLLGRSNRRATQETAKELGWLIVDSPHKSCPSCTAAKAKQKSVVEVSGHVNSKVSNKRIFIDISTVKNTRSSSEKITHPNWLIKVDERTGTKFSTFQRKMISYNLCVNSFENRNQQDYPLNVYGVIMMARTSR